MTNGFDLLADADRGKVAQSRHRLDGTRRLRALRVARAACQCMPSVCSFAAASVMVRFAASASPCREASSARAAWFSAASRSEPRSVAEVSARRSQRGAGGRIVADDSRHSRQSTARRRFTQPLALARATQHMGGVPSRGGRCRPRPRRPRPARRTGPKCRTGSFASPSIAPHRATAAGPDMSPVAAQRANPAAARQAASSNRLRMFSATRAPSVARRSASCQRPCQISETDIQLRTNWRPDASIRWSRSIASSKQACAPSKSPRSASTLPLHDSA